ncbi:phage tail assembly chaperone [Pseudomonas protegens]|uniref:phage tail assembly chaperone n=1 Tax=Pseudomonas protegens TaxID=380021 RepID=UPI002156563A|nr:phage tail assembly chaperone [Pseudomonas protegens]
MNIFFSAKQNAFFNEVLHGTRTLLVPDPDCTPLKDQDEGSATAPLVAVQNPACLLPPENELVQVSQDDHDAIFRALAKGGTVLTSDGNGFPTLAAASGPTVEELEAAERISRDWMLLNTDPLIARHRDEVEAERPTTITAAQYKQLQGYRQDLRDWPQSADFPDVQHRPAAPPWIADQIE